jgi:mono/diheme cytochrome c family protein
MKFRYLIIVVVAFSCIIFFRIFYSVQKDQEYIMPVFYSEEQISGNQLYNDYCISCHQHDGCGISGIFPSLAGNSIVNGSPEDLISLLLSGIKAPRERNAGYINRMPAMQYLGSEEMALIISHIRNSWGNNSPSISSGEVVRMREKYAPAIKTSE